MSLRDALPAGGRPFPPQFNNRAVTGSPTEDKVRDIGGSIALLAGLTMTAVDHTTAGAAVTFLATCALLGFTRDIANWIREQRA